VLLLQRLLLLPLLAPLLVVGLIGAINPRPLVALRLLTWTSPTLSIGLWLSIAAGGGAAISAAATGLALRLGPGTRAMPTRRPTNQAAESHDEIWPDVESQTKGPAKRQSKEASNGPSRSPFQAGPSRAPGEPAPTVAVPFRVIRKAQTASSPPPHAPEAKATAVGDGWDQAASDDW
jgi:hypothetical protein